jgi:hypothetical protein
MPTQNPKISAYVPPVVYDRFKQFWEEREISMSQAVAQVFAEYFDIDLSTSTVRSTSGLLDKVDELSKKIEEMSISFAALSEKVDQISSRSSSPKRGTKKSGFSDEISLSLDLESEPQGELKNELDAQSSVDFLPEPVLPLYEQVDQLKSKNDSKSGANSGNTLYEASLGSEELVPDVESQRQENLSFVLESENKSSLQLGVGDEPQVEFIENSPVKLDKDTLAIRLKHSSGYLTNQKSKLKENFIDWIAEHDPDKIRWVFKKEGKKSYYLLPDDLSQEVKAKVIKWFSEINTSHAELK